MTDFSATTAATSATSSASAPARTTSSVAQVATGTGLGIVGAVVLNAAVFLIAAGREPLRVVTDADPAGVEVGLAAIALASAVWIVIGGSGLWVLERLGSIGTRLWTGLVVVITALSILPLAQVEGTRTQVALAVMHVVVGTAAVAGQRVARRR